MANPLGLTEDEEQESISSMEQQHTPGPWHYRIADNGTPIVETASGEQEVARGGYEGPIAEGEANARLIAAAPDLLAALEDAYADLDRLNTATHPASLLTLTRCFNAIAKARGE